MCDKCQKKECSCKQDEVEHRLREYIKKKGGYVLID